MCEFSNELVTSGRKFQKKEPFLKNQWKSNFWENSSEKHFFWKNPRWNFSFFQKISWKTCFFLPRKRIEKRVTRKFGESLAKVSLKLFLKKMRNCTGTLDFIKNVFAWIFFKKWLFPWFVQTRFSFLLKLFSPRS